VRFAEAERGEQIESQIWIQRETPTGFKREENDRCENASKSIALSRGGHT